MKDKILKDVEEKMKATVEKTGHEFATIRTGRASASLLDRVQVNYYGSPTPLRQLANISVPEPRLLTIHPYDPNSLKGIEKAILQSDLGLTPSSDGTVIKLAIPPLTEERRRDLVKVVRGMAEDARVAIRNIRRETIETYRKMEKNKEITEDDLRRLTEEVQDLTDKYVSQINDLLARKENEVLEV
ncbi:ribosome recycling factor [Candidatus Hakubella thermalkaliphila]|uniref:Ribosome-recycling factor n=2 Tax=Candidatus Hakubella thermalkaliphila TaxID=2754717 RepID=A0A6V8NYK4_9ACTN|nr:ribosome recycling factor [Candidatus Hakubella thermalkaliphila]MBT9170485.1 Ribosome-recycling factor [Actinomycetota bacterium]GFP21306.1 ribosome recycling factor [Candidatus Hakubella thermalkaliphila]GFP25348.1 ribosome recycling factor [Candidatus Hakubella thermalkaliphila]